MMTCVISPRRLSYRFGLLALLSAMALVSGCSILPSPKPIDTYMLPTALTRNATTPIATTIASPTLRIMRPSANSTLSSKRIMVIPKPGQISVYQGAVWSDPPPYLLRNRLIDAFLTDGRLTSVDTGEGPIAQADYLLASQLRSFYSEYENGQPIAIIRLDVQILNANNHRIVAHRSFTLRQPATGRTVPDVVQVLGLASDRLSQEVVDWAVYYVK